MAYSEDTGAGHAYSITYFNVATLQLKYFCCLVDTDNLLFQSFIINHTYQNKRSEKGRNPESISILNKIEEIEVKFPVQKQMKHKYHI